MRKVLIVLLSVLLALSFVSCEKDKSGEIIAVYDEYVRGNNFVQGAFFSLNGLAKSVKDGYIYYNDETTLSGQDITNKSYYVGSIIKIVDGIKSLNVTAAVAKSGTITIKSDSTETTYGRTFTFTDCVINATYDDYSDKETKNDQKKSLTINGTYSYLAKYNEGEKNHLSTTYTFDFSVGDTTCKIEREYDSNSNLVSTKVNGKSVDLRLVNAGN